MATAGRIHPSENVTRAAFASYAASAGGGRFQGKSPASILKSLWPSDEVSPLVSRAAVSAASTGTSTWAGVLAEQAVGAFFGALPTSAASRLIAAGATIPLERRASIRFPKRSGASAVLPWVDEGAPIPVKAYSLDAATLGPAGKFATIVVLSAELARASDAVEVFSAILREDAALSLDGATFSTEAASDTHPAGLLNGVTPLAAATGGGLGAMQADLAALAGAVATGGGSGSVAFVAHPAQAAAVAIFAPELRLPVWPSRALADGTVIALDPTAFVSGFAAVPDISTSEQATIHTDTAPVHIGTAPNVVAAPTRSLFQTRAIAVRLIADVAFTMRAANAVAVVNSVSW